MKKALCLILVSLMLLACLPLTALAADTDVCKIGNTGYATLDAAITAVKDGETIVLVKNATMTKFNTNAISYTIDGQNKAYTVSTGAGNFYTGNANLTFKNVNIEFGGSGGQTIIHNGKGTTGDLIFEGCIVNAYNNSFYRLDGRGNFTLRNSTWTKKTGNATAFYSRGYNSVTAEDECNFTVENSTIVNEAGSNSQMQNNNVFHWNSYDNGNVKIHLKGNTVIKNASTNASATKVCLFYNERTSANMTIYADSTVELILAPTSTNIAQAYFIYTTPSSAGLGTPVTTLYGTPKLTVSSGLAAQKKTYMPLVTSAHSIDGSKKYSSWSDGTTDFAIGAVCTSTATSFTPVADTAATSGKVAYIKTPAGANTGYYATLDAALAAATNNCTVVLIANATLSAFNQNSINYTIDGQNKTYAVDTKGSSSGYYINLGNSNVTFKNVKVNLGPDGWSIPQNDTGKTGDFTFEGCQIKAYNSSFIKHNGLGNITFRNCTYDRMSGDATFYFRGDHASVGADQCIITLENTVMTNYGGSASMIQNNSIFHVNSSAGSTYKFYLKGNTVLKNASENANATVGCIFHNQQPKAKIIINVEPTVKFEMASVSTKLSNVCFIYSNPTATTTINGTPTYVVSDNVAAQGFNFNNVNTGMTVNGGKVLAYKGNYADNSGSIYIGETVAAGKLTKGITVTPETYTTSDFDIKDGAALRTKDGSGIRFTTHISDALIEKISDRASFGTLIAQNVLLKESGKALTLDILTNEKTVALDVPSTVTKWQTEGDGKVYHAALIGIPDTAFGYSTEISARSYMSVSYDDGSVKTFYSDFDSNNVRTMNRIATTLKGMHDDPNVDYTMSDSVLTAINNVIETGATYGTLTIEAPAKIYTNYPAKDLTVTFSKPEMAEELTFTTNNANVTVVDGKISATGIFNSPCTVVVKATSEHFIAYTTLTVATYQGATASGSSLNLETQIVTRHNQIASQSNGNTDNCVLFVGDSFFNPDNWWTSFYSDYMAKKAYTVGVSSSTAEDWQVISERLVYPYAPKAVVLHIGTNDIFDDKLSADATTARLEALLSAYHENMPDTTIYWFTIEPRVGKDFEIPKTVNANITAFAADKDWLVVLDSASWCFLEDGTTVDSTFFKDGIHPANEKYALYRQALTDAGLVIDVNDQYDYNSLPDLVRDKSQSIGSSALTASQGGTNVVTEYLITGKMTVTDLGTNAHAEFKFNTDSNRFLIWDKDSDRNLGIGWCAGGTYTNETANEEYLLGSSPLVLEWKLLFTAKNAYLYINGTLKAVYYNVPSPTRLIISTEQVSAEYTDMKVYTKALDEAVYNEALAAVSAYEAQAGTSARVERVG